MNIIELNQEIQSKGAKWVASENPISALDETTKKRLLGVIEPAGYVRPVKTDVKASVKLPASIDWRNHMGQNYVTDVKNQEVCGSCVAFGTLAAMESRIAIENNMLLNLSEGDAFFCSSHGANCEGWWPYTAFEANQSRGIIQEVLFPYQLPPVCINVPNRSDNAFSYANINANVVGLTASKNYLANNGPIAAVMQVFSDFQYYSSGIYTQTSNDYQGLHCICVVGYCDDSSVSGGGYWICKNSWGTNWGMSGYFNIAYGQCMIDDNEKVGVSGIVSPSTIYTNWIKNLSWNGNYFPGTDGLSEIYADTNPVLCPDGKIITGFAFYQKGNRIAPMIQCADSDGSNYSWIDNPAWNNDYFPGEQGLSEIYADTNKVFCPLGKIIKGVAFYKKGNRIAPKILCSNPDGSNSDWVVNDDWNDNYFPPTNGLSEIYADSNHLISNNQLVGLGFYEKGNRIAPMILSAHIS
jgi:C1A family cysteine protease